MNTSVCILMWSLMIDLSRSWLKLKWWMSIMFIPNVPLHIVRIIKLSITMRTYSFIITNFLFCKLLQFMFSLCFILKPILLTKPAVVVKLYMVAVYILNSLKEFQNTSQYNCLRRSVCHCKIPWSFWWKLRVLFH